MRNVKKYQPQLVVRIRNVPTTDADGRIARAISILLKAAARDTITSKKDTVAEKEKPPHHIPREEGLIGDHEESDSNE